MSSIDDQKGTNAPPGSDASPANGDTPEVNSPKVDDPYGAYDDGYPHEESETVAEAPVSTSVVPSVPASSVPAPLEAKPSGNGGGKTPPPSGGDGDGGDGDGGDGGEEEDGMLRMSFLEHLEEL